jgi:hypothetical protein
MNCLENYIGLRSCTAGTPLSNLWINDLPGMSTELLDKIATTDQITYAGVWESIQRSAYEDFKFDIQNALYLSAEAQLDQVLFQTSKNFVQNWQQIDPLPAAAEYRGVFVSIEGSKYLGLRVKQLYIYNAGAVAVQDVDLKIYQTQDAKLLWNDSVVLLPGMNYVPVNEVFYSDFDKVNIALMVDCTELDTLQGSFIDYGWNQMDIECATRFTYLWRNGWSIFPITAPLEYGLGVDWSQDNSQSGIYWDAELLCSLDAFICGQREFLKMAYAYKLAYQVLWNKMLTQRGNYFAQSNKDITERNMATMDEKYKAMLATWARQLNLAAEGLCFNCEEAALVQVGRLRP